MNTDIVACDTVGFDHVPRPEDWPQMPIMWPTFAQRQFQFVPPNRTTALPNQAVIESQFAQNGCLVLPITAWS
jgi:Cu2+-containing amine oxidase